MIRIPTELQPYLTYTEAGLEEIKPVPQELRKEAEDLRESYRVAHDPSNLSEYKEDVMSEPRPEYIKSTNGYVLRADLERVGRQIHHDIEVYVDDMSPELIEELKIAEKAMGKVVKMLKDRQSNS